MNTKSDVKALDNMPGENILAMHEAARSWE